MPTAYVAKVAASKGQRVRTVDAIWKRAEKRVTDEYGDIPRSRHFALTTAIFKKMAHVTESVVGVAYMSEPLDEVFKAAPFEHDTAGGGVEHYHFTIGGEHGPQDYRASIAQVSGPESDGHPGYHILFSRKTATGYDDESSEGHKVDMTSLLATMRDAVKHHLTHIVAKDYPAAKHVTYESLPAIGAKDTDPAKAARRLVTYDKIAHRTFRDDPAFQTGGTHTTKTIKTNDSDTDERFPDYHEIHLSFPKGVHHHFGMKEEVTTGDDLGPVLRRGVADVPASGVTRVAPLTQGDEYVSRLRDLMAKKRNAPPQPDTTTQIAATVDNQLPEISTANPGAALIMPPGLR